MFFVEFLHIVYIATLFYNVAVIVCTFALIAFYG